MRKIIWAAVIFLIMIIAVPIILNFIVLSHIPLNIPVVGQSTDWLTFWGAYLGGIIAASIGLVTLFVTSRQNHLSQMILLKENSLRRLEDDVTTRLEQLDYSQLYSLSLRVLSGISLEDIQGEVLRLNSIHARVSALADSWGAIHKNDSDEFAIDFNDKYLSCLTVYKEEINKVTRFYSRMICQKQFYKKFDSNHLNQMLGSAKGVCEPYYQALFDSASRWIDSENSKVNLLISKHRRLL